MKNVLVTGGCGFLGSWIVRQLVERGCSVVVFAVPGENRENLEGVDVTVVEGDVRRRADVEAAFEAGGDIDTVFHAAAVYQDYAPDPTLMYDVNLRGTFNMMEASRRAGVEKVVYTASMVSLGRPPVGQTADEDTPYEAWDLDFAYSRSKLFSRQIAEFFVDWDLDVRIVCPGLVLGPGDLRPTPSGALIVKLFTFGLPAVHFDGGVSYVDVRDAAKVHLLAADKGKAGERYLAVNTNMTNEEFVRMVRRIGQTKKPLVKLPEGVARTTAIAMDKLASVTGEPPLLTREFFEYCLRPSYYRNDKARQELGATFRPIEETVRDSIAYFRSRGAI
ncbi:MAG: SDR family NAD(P)-dependent oxidoreductase [Sandaracinaceae bacterium]